MADSINKLNELEALNASILINASSENVYFLPEGYFTDFSNNIISQIWLNSVSKTNPYFLPADYFENLPGIVLDKISVQSQPIINEQVYKVPDGYFNNLAENILNKIRAQENNVQQELEEIAPLLSQLPKTNVYSVPAGYFEALTPKTTLKIQPAKVISISSKIRKWITYAAAACIAALMFASGYFYVMDKKSSDKPSSDNRYADTKVQQAISQLSDTAIANYLKDDNTDIYIPQNDSQQVDINTLIQNMSDEEINNYLMENSDPGENVRGS